MVTLYRSPPPKGPGVAPRQKVYAWVQDCAQTPHSAPADASQIAFIPIYGVDRLVANRGSQEAHLRVSRAHGQLGDLCGYAGYEGYGLSYTNRRSCSTSCSRNSFSKESRSRRETMP